MSQQPENEARVRNYHGWIDNVEDTRPAHPIKAWTKGLGIEEAALKQLTNVASLPFIFKHVAVMPDVHAGYGATVGTVIATQGAVVPSAVGVDIGCGMTAAQTNLMRSDLPEDLSELRRRIEARVPHGRTNRGRQGDRGAWGNIPAWVQESWDRFLEEGYRRIISNHAAIDRNATVEHLGTLGSGNHFIEICVDSRSRVWVMLHSGSRGPGNRIGTHFTKLAKLEMDKWFISLPDKDLAYFPQWHPCYKEYIDAMLWAQEFARINRGLMMLSTIEALSSVYGGDDLLVAKQIDCHHNYAQFEHHFGQNVLVTRKGAVNAEKGRFGIIPGSMGAKSYIVAGLGNPESFNSCSHGAGRVMSRTKARDTFTVEDHIKATEGVECRKDADVIDETPAAYKNIDDVMIAQEDLVKPVETLRQIVCVKG